MRISVSSRSGGVRVTARDGATVEVKNGIRREAPDGTIMIEPERSGSKRIELVCPTGSHLTIGTASGAIELTGQFGSVKVVTGSGKVEIDHVAGLDLLAYRHPTADTLELIRAVVQASSGPVIVAGSIASVERAVAVSEAGAWGYTIGSAIFDGLLPGAPSIADQVRRVLEETASGADSPAGTQT